MKMKMNVSRNLNDENRRLSAELQRARDEIRSLLSEGSTDELTGLLNRRGFLRLAGEELSIARAGNRSLTLVYIDVDGLKAINDRHGHAAGDRLLADTASLLRRVFRETDVVARIGGDEFVVLTRDFCGTSRTITDRLDEVSALLYATGSQRFPVALSAGVVVVNPKADDTWESMLDGADTEMYSIKKSRGAKPSGTHEARVRDSGTLAPAYAH